MKTTIQFSFKGHLLLALFIMSGLLFGTAQAQETPSEVFLEVTKLKKANDDFLAVEREIVKPFVQKRIEQGNQIAHFLFRVVYPNSEDEHDYIALDVYGDFNHIQLGQEHVMRIASEVFPPEHHAAIIERYKGAATRLGSSVYVVRDEIFPGLQAASEEPGRFVRVNFMDVKGSQYAAYEKMESEVFKPLHREAAHRGWLHEWVLAERLLPYGSEWKDDFLTFDVFREWKDLNAGSLSELLPAVHPELNSEKLWEEIQALRTLERSEIWEVVHLINTPPAPITFETVKEGSGPSPQWGQDVGFSLRAMDMNGNTLFSSDELGFLFHHIIGSDPYDQNLDAGLLQMKKGGIVTFLIPAEMNDNGNGPVVWKVYLKKIGPRQPNGMELLAETIREEGLAEAIALYTELKSDNPIGYVFREGDMNNLGYQLMQEGLDREAVFVFMVNHKNFPKSWNACDSLADGYRNCGDFAQAKKHYQMALELNPEFQAAKNKLQDLDLD